MPPLPSRKSPPNGIIANAKNAGTKVRYGASLKTNLSERSGKRSSLKNNLMPSARVCNRPHGPALFGPTRFCIPAMTFRSNHTMSMVATRPTTKTMRTLTRTMINGVHNNLPSSNGSTERSAEIILTQSERQRLNLIDESVHECLHLVD